MSDKNDLVIDPYLGVGTTVIAALKNNRKAQGSDTVAKYISISKQRIKLLKNNNLPYRKMNTPIQMVKGKSKLYIRK